MIKEGYLARHYGGRQGGRDPALLDVAQDYALRLILDSGLYSMGLTLKGGTALRKYRLGNRGRFSTDLDFAANEEGMGELLFGTLNGNELHDVRFSLSEIQSGSRAKLIVETPLGNPQIDSKIEVKVRQPWVKPQWLDPVRLPVHEAYEFEPAQSQVMALEETLAEKLAAFRRRELVRDLYDLAMFSVGQFDENLVRELTYLKVFIDVVVDGLGSAPFNPDEDILREREASGFQAEDIGLLTGKVDITGWIENVRNRYGFLRNTTQAELRWSKCSRQDRYQASAAIRTLIEQT